MHTCYVDIETIPVGDAIDPRTLTPPGNMKKAETIEAWFATEAPKVADEVFRKRSLDSMAGQIFCISWAIDDEDPKCVSLANFDEGGLVQELERAMSSLKSVVWVGHNALSFDMLWLWRRALKYDLPWLAQEIKLDRYRGNVRDTMLMWGGADPHQNRCKLADIAAFLGIEDGKMEGVDGSQVYDLYLAGELDKIAAYCCQDVALVRQVYRRLGFCL